MSFRRAANGDEQFESMMRELLRRVDRIEAGFLFGPGISLGPPVRIGDYELSINGLGQLIATNLITTTVTVVAIP
jgi:hypothetical protein